MVTPPSNVNLGTVVGQFIIDVDDSDDTGAEPDFITPTGTVQFTASVSKLINASATPNPVSILRSTITGVLDADGYLCTPDDAGVPVHRGVMLIATDDPDLNPTGWVWNVTYALRDPRTNSKITAPQSHTMALPSDAIVDLATVIPPDGAQVIGLPQAEAAAAAAAADAQAAWAASAAAEASAAAAQAALLDSSAFVDTTGASLIDTPGTALEGSVAAKIATSIGSIPAGSDTSFMSDIADPWDGLMRSLAVSAERTRMEALFASTGTRVAVGRSGTEYRLYQELSGNLWWRAALAMGTAHSLWGSRIERPHLSLAAADPSWTYGGTWMSILTNAASYGGTYHRSESPGATATWVSPAAATHVGVRSFVTTNGGYAKVTIDGSATAADFLPTAQDEVTAGRLASTALVANGGTLNPTDRLYDSYNPVTSQPDKLIPFNKTALTAGSHTAVLTVTGYKQAASTGLRTYVSGGMYSTAAQTPATANMTGVPIVHMLVGSSVYEYAIAAKPTGGTIAFVGNRHGGETETAFAIKLDGAAKTLTDGEIALGARVDVDRTTTLSHAGVVGNIGTGALTYTVTPRGGLDVYWTINWATALETSSTYPAMLPTEGNTFNRGRAAGGPVVTPLDDDGSAKGSTRSDTLALWQHGGHGAVMATIRNLPTAVDRWQAVTNRYAWIEDRLGGDFNKGYFSRGQDPSTIAPGDVWESHATYRAAWMTDTSPLAL